MEDTKENKEKKIKPGTKSFNLEGRPKGTTSANTKLRYKVLAANMVKNGMKLKDAMLKTGYTPLTIARSGAEILERPDFKEAFNEVLQQEDLLDNHLRLYTHKKWRHTRTETYFDEDGKKITKKVFEETGEPDMDLVVKGLDMAHKIRGDYDKDKKEMPGKNSHKIYNIFYNPEVKKQVGAFENLIKAKIYEQSNAKLKTDDDEETPEYFDNQGGEGENGEDVDGGSGEERK